MEFEPVTLSTGNNPDEVPSDGKPERLFFNIDQLQNEHPGKRSWSDLAVRKNRAHANIICGYGIDVKHRPGDLGHYHTDFAEMWVIMRGQQTYDIEGLAPFTAASVMSSTRPPKDGTVPNPPVKDFLPFSDDPISGRQPPLSAPMPAPPKVSSPKSVIKLQCWVGMTLKDFQTTGYPRCGGPAALIRVPGRADCHPTGPPRGLFAS